MTSIMQWTQTLNTAYLLTLSSVSFIPTIILTFDSNCDSPSLRFETIHSDWLTQPMH